jgi:hypothetical protein
MQHDDYPCANDMPHPSAAEIRPAIAHGHSSADALLAPDQWCLPKPPTSPSCRFLNTGVSLYNSYLSTYRGVYIIVAGGAVGCYCCGSGGYVMLMSGVEVNVARNCCRCSSVDPATHCSAFTCLSISARNTIMSL